MNKRVTDSGTGMSSHPLYRVWNGMRYRCLNPKSSGYQYYGGRGITVCEEWQTFKPFLDWALPRWKPGLTIERIDVNGPYSPENCTFIPPWKQQWNKRNTRYLTAFGETKILAEWARDARCSVSLQTLCKRLAKGWDAQKAVETSSVQGRAAENDPRRNGKPKEGELNPAAILTEEDVRRIRELVAAKITTQVALAKEYGVAARTVRAVVARTRWKHLP